MKSSNEELVRLIQSGQSEHIPQLWSQTEGFIRYMAARHLSGYPEHFNDLKEDMVNQSYCHFLRAIKCYREDRGKFTSYLSFHIKNAFNEVLQGRSKRLRNDPLNAAVSIDLPVGDTEDLTLDEMLIDQTAELYFRYIEDKDLWQSVNSIIREAIDQIPEAYQPFFLIMLENGTGVSDTLRLMGVDLKEKGRYYEMYRKGLRVIRMFIKKRIRQTHDIALEECISFHTGIGSWRNRCFTSTVEQAVMKRNDPRYTAQAVGEVLVLG